MKKLKDDSQQKIQENKEEFLKESVSLFLEELLENSYYIHLKKSCRNICRNLSKNPGDITSDIPNGVPGLHELQLPKNFVNEFERKTVEDVLKKQLWRDFQKYPW